jgi:hypothetical protein
MNCNERQKLSVGGESTTNEQFLNVSKVGDNYGKYVRQRQREQKTCYDVCKVHANFH